MKNNAEKELVALLVAAYSGELAAMKAYQGHAAAVKDDDERSMIKRIEGEELHHRIRVGEMLVELGAGEVSRYLEWKMSLIGFVIGSVCRLVKHIPGAWFAGMYGAGLLESRNIHEYEAAAQLAMDAGQAHLVEDLLQMAETEWDHEKWFQEKIVQHPLYNFVPHWAVPLPKESIRKRFYGEGDYSEVLA